jgi:hypothetical protein
VSTTGAAATTPGVARVRASASRQRSIGGRRRGEHPDVGAADEDLLAQVALQPVHHAHDEDERADPTATPPMAMTLMSDSRLDPRRLRR